MSELYNKLAQEYYHYSSEKRKLIQTRESISAKIETIEDVLTALNDVLCKSGNHIYEHFEESEPQESEG